ncbi:MAG: alpha/beta hydrolase [Nodosilinea sp.]
MTLSLLVVAFSPQFFSQPRPRRPWIRALLVGALTAWGVVAPESEAMATESITLKWGALSQTIGMEALEEFAATGEVPSGLGHYRPLLTPRLREALRGQIDLDPAVSKTILDEILSTPGGIQPLETLETLAPNLDVTDLQSTLELVSGAPERSNTLGILQALPQDTLELNVGALVSLAVQFRLTQMENEALSQVLRREQDQGAPGSTPLQGVEPFSKGPSQVERWELTLQDRDRDRSIPIDIYWSEDTHGPLVVISHGFGADRRFFAYLAEHLASHGLTVVSVEHPGSNVSALLSVPSVNQKTKVVANRILPAGEFLDRPKDISYVLDRMEKLNVYSYSLRDRLNTQQVTLIGHSLGGYTGFALAGAKLDLRHLDKFCQKLSPVNVSPSDWLQCAALDLPTHHANLRDNRITQLVVTNPMTGQLFGETGLSQVKVPTLMLASTHDGVTPIAKQQLAPFRQLSGPKYLVTALGGSHLSVGDPDNLNADLRYIPFMPHLPDESTANLRIFLQGVSLSFIMQQTPEARAYAGALSADYAEYFSTPTLPLRLSQDLPNGLARWPRLNPRALYRQDKLLTYVPSLLHLESMALQGQFQLMQRQLVAWARSSPSSLTAVYWPPQFLRPQTHAHRPNENSATP